MISGGPISSLPISADQVYVTFVYFDFVCAVHYVSQATKVVSYGSVPR